MKSLHLPPEQSLDVAHPRLVCSWKRQLSEAEANLEDDDGSQELEQKIIYLMEILAARLCFTSLIS